MIDAPHRIGQVIAVRQFHLQGQHDQATHGRGGAGSDADAGQEPLVGRSALYEAVDDSLQTAWFDQSDEYDIDDYGYEAYMDFEEYDGSDTSDFAALAYYLSAGYEPMNLGLRTGNELSAADRQAVEKLTGAIDAADRITDPIIVHRGVSAGVPEDVQPGQMLHDPGFMSTSTNPGDADLFASDVMFDLEVPAGTRALAGSVGEDEVLIQRGSSIEVIEVTRQDGYRRIKGRVVQP